MQKLQFKKVHEDAILPQYAHENDSGLDIFAIEDDYILPSERKLIRTGLSVRVPIYRPIEIINKILVLFGIKIVLEIQVRPRSGLANSFGVTVCNSPGTIDQDFTGEIMVNLINLGDEKFKITKHKTKICQLVLAPVFHVLEVEFTEEDFEDTDRGPKGHGSTGL
jgi:dUTP pyrophosphatase